VEGGRNGSPALRGLVSEGVSELFDHIKSLNIRLINCFELPRRVCLFACFLLDTSINKDIYATIIHNEYKECHTLRP